MKNILWIDDDSKLIDSSIPIFQQNDFFIFKAINTSRALSLLREHINSIDGILLDIRLQGEENGLELLEEIVNLYPKLKIAVFTGYPEYIDHLVAERTGASIYLNKINKSIPLAPEKQQSFFKMLHEIFPKRPREEKKSKLDSSKNNINIYLSGIFLTIIFIVLAMLIAFLSNRVAPLLFPIVLISSVIIYSIIGAFILKLQGDSYLTQKKFLKLMFEAFKYLPLIKRSKNSNSND